MRASDIAAALAVPLAVGLVMVTTGTPEEPQQTSQVSRTVPVEQTTLVCPPLQAGSTDPDDVRAAVVPAPLDKHSPLPDRPVRITAGQQRLARVQSRGHSWSGGEPAIAKGLEITADGALAAGLAASVGAVFNGEARGLATMSCTQPTSHAWFVGAASTADRSTVLHLANPTPGVAVVELNLYGPDGPVESAKGQGVAVAPGERRSIPLVDLVPGVEAVAVEVSTTQGEIAAALTEVDQDALDPAGVDAIPAAAEPARTAVLTGIPGGPGQHALSVFNAGSSAAVVELEVLGKRGPFVASDLETVRAPAHGVVEAELPADVLQGDAAGIRLKSDQPVSAAVRSAGGGALRDQSFSVTGDPLVSGSVTPVVPGLDGELVLSSVGRGAATVDVTRLAAGGKSTGSRTVDVRAGQTRTLEIRGRPATVRVRVSGAGQVVGAATWSQKDPGGAMTSTLPLSPLRLSVERPPVAYSIAGP